MSNGSYQFEKQPGGVARAVSVATDFVNEIKDEEDAGSVERAVGAVARKSQIGKSFILRLIQPSRRPKTIDTDVWSRLRTAYLDFLRTQHRAIELKIIRVEAMARDDDAAIRNLLDEAEALQGRIRSLL